MNEINYEEQLKALKEGTLPELVVDPQNFMAFREVWKNLPDRMSIVGEAGLNGRIIYRYIKQEE
ncbi:hypothetical protein [Enterococcus sp. UD-01]|jgi:hypothetical protein|uniref:hypothetical protein n=1 Tax=Enterococcus sp. UD-01 TaxID=3373911 RepID=UPI0038328B58